MSDRNSLNKVILIGNLGGDPELRYLPQNERAVARFNLATNEKYYKPDSTESESRTEWHRIVAWGKLAEFCEKYLAKGKQICLEGKLRTNSWQDRDGNKRTTTEIVAQSIVMLGKRDDYEQQQAGTSEKAPDFPDSQPSSPEKQGDGQGGFPEKEPDFPDSQPSSPEKQGEEDDDIPF